MTIGEWLNESTNTLKQSGVGTARLDCLILLEDALGKNRAWVLAHPEYIVEGPSFHKLEKQIEQREKHIPLAQIRGKTEFYGREFIINEHVLEPRSESETMIELALKLVKSTRQKAKSYSIIDVGTGSGALGVTAKLEIPSAEVILTDIDQKCLEVARKNAHKHTIDATIVKGDLLKAVQFPKAGVCLLLCNLPYVPDNHRINQAAMNEPRIAIFGGEDGLDLYRKLFEQLHKIANKSQFVLTESLPFQHDTLKKIAEAADYKQVQEEDFIQVFEKNL